MKAISFRVSRLVILVLVFGMMGTAVWLRLHVETDAPPVFSEYDSLQTHAPEREPGISVIVRRDAGGALVLAIVCIALLVAAAFQRPFMAMLVPLSLIAGTTTSLFLYTLLFPSMDVITLRIGCIVLCASMDVGLIYLLLHDGLHPLTSRSVSREVRAVCGPAVLATSIAYAALVFPKDPFLNQLGVFVSLGLLFTFVFVCLVFPWLLHGITAGMTLKPAIAARIHRWHSPGIRSTIMSVLLFSGVAVSMVLVFYNTDTTSIPAVETDAFSMLVFIVAGITILQMLLMLIEPSLTVVALIPASFACISTFGLFQISSASTVFSWGFPVVIVFFMDVRYSLYFIAAYQRYEVASHSSFRRIRLAVFLSGMFGLIGFAALGLLRHPALQSLGFSVSFGIACLLISMFALLPPVLTYRFRRSTATSGSQGSPEDLVRRRYRRMAMFPRLFASC